MMNEKTEKSHGSEQTCGTDDGAVDAAISGVNLKLLEGDEEQKGSDCSKEETVILNGKVNNVQKKSDSVNKVRNHYKERHRVVISKSSFNSARYQKCSSDDSEDSFVTDGGVGTAAGGSGGGKKDAGLKISKKDTKGALFDIDDECWHDDRELSYAQRNINWFIKVFTPLSMKNGCVERADFLKIGRRNNSLGRHLFRLLDSDGNGRLAYEELIGGLKKLACRESQRLHLKWFEDFIYQRLREDIQDIEIGSFVGWAKNEEFLRRFFDMTDIQGNGRPSMQQFLGSLDKLTCMDKDAKWLAWAEQRFAQVAGEDRLIYLDEFKKALNVKKSFFAERFFELIDADNSGNISLSELMDALRVLVHGSAADKLHFLFRVYDVDGNGTIDYEELRTVLRSCTAESALQLCDETLDELTQVLFEEADSDCSGNICFEELRAQLEKYPDIAGNLTISASEWLRPPSLQRTQLNNGNCCNFSAKNIRNNIDMLIFTTLYVATHVACIVSGVLMGYRMYPDSPWVMVARSSGRCLSFNCVFILILMLKKCLTILRSTKLSTYLPMDQHVDLHRYVGYAIVFFSVIHTCGHTANYVQWSQHTETNYTLVDYLFTINPGIGWVFGTANVTGWALLFILAIIVLCSTPCIRRNGYFQVFYWTHQLAFIFWILLLIHSRTFWMWALLPGAIYIVERILRLKPVQRARHGRTYIKKAVLLPANVTHLVIPRQANFRFHAGEYVYINIPAIARHEWHPFTISSAPEQMEFITIHIRAIGNWTKRLYDFFREQELEEENRRVDSSYEAFQATNPIFSKNQILESLAEEGSMSHSEDVNASSVATKSTYVDLESEINKETMRKTSQTSAALSEFSIPGSVTETEPTETVESDTTRNTAVDSVDENAKKVLLEKDTESKSPKDIEPSINGGRSKLRVPRGSRRKTKPFSTSPKKTTTVPLLSQSNDVTSSKPRTQNSGDEINSRTPTTIPVIRSQSLTKMSLLQHESKGSKSKTLTRRDSSKSSIKSGRTAATVGKRVLGRKATQHSLNISNIEEFGNEDTGVEVYIDGPYGAPAQHIFEAEHAVLIGAGIGVTPFASILQSIHMRYKAARNSCPSCGHKWMDGDIPSLMRLKKVDFFWINRHQRSFEWFISLLNQIEVEQEEMALSKRFITMRLYMTSALGKNDMKAIGLHMALDLIHQKRQRDMITGLMTKTEAGRPDWNQVFKQLEEERKGKVTVFFCGSPHLGNVIRQKCLQHGFDFRKENF